MPCYHPLTISVKNSKTFSQLEWSTKSKHQQIVPCGRCIGCRLERSRQWAVRIMDEARYHKSNSFLTLTYDDAHLVYGGNTTGTLVKDHLQKFWKRLRKSYGTLRYFACGEYGSITNRPHYHACLFGLDFKDERKLYSTSRDSNLYRSDSLNTLWGHGHVTIGDLTFESAAYVARYITGKKLGKDASYYEIEGIEPEYSTCSLKPGIGAKFFEEFHSDIYPHDLVISRGVKCKPPRYYDKLLQKCNQSQYDLIKSTRAALLNNVPASEQSQQRLGVKERVKRARLISRRLE